MEWIMMVIIGAVISIIVYLIMLYWLKATLEENIKAMGTNPSTLPGYSGGWLPWDVHSDVGVLNKSACEGRYNPNVDADYDGETGEVTC